MCNQPLRDDQPLARLLSGQTTRLPALCRRCLAQFELIDQQDACPGCGRGSSSTLCQDCQRWAAQGETLLHHRAWFRYTAPMKAFIQQYKGLGDYRLHSAFADVLQLASRNQALVPIPSEPGHYARRGFDPVLGLFGHLPLALWLTKGETAVPQAQKTRAERLVTAQSFTAHLPAVVPPRIVLLDDLYTTGRTLYHAKAALRAAGYQGEVISRSLIR
ncbi:ComF family protein [Lacticaseibacillus camelliae]|uniref:Competence protein F n=1 Tax=Lacticaseibacillus camelliae DSM 22697 = JCM 13995 TaxID=1423730 RepID=A0A0R2F7H8_9LACO|nr:ComF family protein [Lacticaseibacillus camelliae]KRN20733.1 competence protein F [Lacticaseibacillus camelliae DSM 22697 = JCM 13995]